MQKDADMCICCNRTHWKQWCHWQYQLIWAFMHSVNGIIIFSEFDYGGHTLICAWCVWLFVPPVLWHCWLGDRKGIWPVKKVSGGMLAWFSVWSEVQTCMWPSWCHCHSLSLASVKSGLVLPFWYWLTWVVPEKGPLNGCVCVCVCVCVCACVRACVRACVYGSLHLADVFRSASVRWADAALICRFVRVSWRKCFETPSSEKTHEHVW